MGVYRLSIGKAFTYNAGAKEPMRPVHWIEWIETEFSRHFNENLDLTYGVDLDRNGAIEGTERTDRNGDIDVNSEEWQRFMQDNRAALKRLGGHFKQYYSAGTAFSLDNPIHDLLSIESEMESPKDVEIAYKKVHEILGIVRKRLSDSKLDPQGELRLLYIYRTMRDVGIKVRPKYGSSFISDINDGILDCDTFGLLVLAIAHEMNWPVYLVEVPKHAFVRWDDGAGTIFNMNYFFTTPDSFYVEKHSMSQDAIERGVYLKNMNYGELLALMYGNRGYNKHENGDREGAIRDFDKAIELNPNFARVYYYRGYTYETLGRYKKAAENYDKLIELDPNYAGSYYNRGLMKYNLGRYEEAKADFEKAFELDPNFTLARKNFIIMKRKLKRRTRRRAKIRTGP